MTETNRRDGELIRLRHALERMAAHIDSLQKAMSLKSLASGGPIGTETAQAITSTAIEIAMQIAKHDAYLLAEGDADEASRKNQILDKLIQP